MGASFESCVELLLLKLTKEKCEGLCRNVTLISAILRLQQFTGHRAGAPSLALVLGQFSIVRALLWNIMVASYPFPPLQFLRQ